VKEGATTPELTIAALHAEADVLAALGDMTSAYVVTPHEEDAEPLRAIGIEAAAIVDRVRLDRELPTGPNSRIILVGGCAQHAGDFRARGVEETWGLHVPPGYVCLGHAIEDRMRVAQWSLDNVQAHEIWRVIASGTHLLDDVPSTNHPELQRAAPQPLRFLRPYELASLPPRRLLWGAGFGVGELGLLFGPWGSCKSFLTLALGVAIADGEPFLGHATTPGTVLFVVGEGAAGQADRLRAATSAARMLDRADPMHERLGTACIMPALNSTEGFDATVRAIEARTSQPSLLVIDTVARALCAAGLDENGTAEMGLFVAAADRLRARFPGMTVLCVHHPGNDRVDRARGSNVLPSAADFIAHVEPIRKSSLPRVKVVYDKVKDGERPAPQVVDFAQIVVRDGAEGEPVTSLRVAGFSADDDESEARPKVRAADVLVEALRDAGDGGLRFADARAALSKTNSTTSEALKRLVESGQAASFIDDSGAKRWRSGPRGLQ
jgi:hypothetical protein